MVILREKAEKLTVDDDLTPHQSFTSQLTRVPSDEFNNDELDEDVETEVETPINDLKHSILSEGATSPTATGPYDNCENDRPFSESDDGSGTFAYHDRHFEPECISEQSSSERFSSSPVMLSPPGTGTPVYIASQPGSIDLDSNNSSLGTLGGSDTFLEI